MVSLVNSFMLTLLCKLAIIDFLLLSLNLSKYLSKRVEGNMPAVVAINKANCGYLGK